MRSKVLVLDSSNALKRLAFEHDIDDALNSGYDIEESYIVSEEKIVFLLLSCRCDKWENYTKKKERIMSSYYNS